MPGETISTDEHLYKMFTYLYLGYSKTMIMKRLRITEKVYQKLANKYIKENLKEGDPQLIFSEKIPFSENEMDYGTKFFQINKFNTIIKKNTKPTKLEKIIRLYKKSQKLYGRDVQQTNRQQSDP